jgi:hypothetical protein
MRNGHKFVYIDDNGDHSKRREQIMLKPTKLAALSYEDRESYLYKST